MNIDIKNLSKEQIEDLKKQLLEYKEEPIEWTIDGMYIGDDDNKYYFYINDFFEIQYGYGKTVTGLSFQTKEQAEKFRDKLQALKTIKKWHTLNNNFEPDWSDEEQKKYFVGYDFDLKKLDYDIAYDLKYIPLLPYYSSEEKVIQAMKELEKEYLVIFDVI